MITIIHGDDIAKSQKKYDEYLKKNTWVVHIMGDKQHPKDVELALSEQELFESKKTIVVERILKFPKKELDTAISLLKNSSKDIIIWNQDTFDKGFLEKFKGATVLEFALPKYFFTFLDSFYPSKGKTLHTLLASLSQEFAAEQIFFALTKRVRLLLMVKTGGEQSFIETQKMSPWQLSKIREQARYWNINQIVHMYQLLFTLEIERKTGELTTNLLDSLDLLLVRDLR